MNNDNKKISKLILRRILMGNWLTNVKIKHIDDRAGDFKQKQ